jgi:hypothetical protein
MGQHQMASDSEFSWHIPPPFQGPILFITNAVTEFTERAMACRSVNVCPEYLPSALDGVHDGGF